MKIDVSSNNADFELIGNIDIRSNKARIYEKNIPFFVSLIPRIYSDRFGSIVREITSNACDAHIRANIPNEPVIIRKFVDSVNQTYIEFVDRGQGISIKQMDEVYMSIGESDKRGDNSEYGGFGLGSKSPLSYSSYFYIITCVDGIKYTYLINSSLDGITYDCLDEVELEDDSITGTTIRIPINQKSLDSDINEFEKALNSQLKYFSNVYVDGFSFNNDFKIIDKFDTFKLVKRSNFDSYEKNLHVSIGMVQYPIDYNIVNRKPIKLDVALKFDIGDLDIVLNREHLEYTQKTIDAIKEKIDDFVIEFNKLFVDDYFVESDINKFLEKEDLLKSGIMLISFDDDNQCHKIDIQTIDPTIALDRKLTLSINNETFCFNKNVFLKGIISSGLRLSLGTKSYSELRKINAKTIQGFSTINLLVDNIKNKYAFIIDEEICLAHERRYLNKNHFTRLYTLDSDRLFEKIKVALREEDIEPSLEKCQVLYTEILDLLNKTLTNIRDLNIEKSYGIKKKIKSTIGEKSLESFAINMYRYGYVTKDRCFVDVDFFKSSPNTTFFYYATNRLNVDKKFIDYLFRLHGFKHVEVFSIPLSRVKLLPNLNNIVDINNIDSMLKIKVIEDELKNIALLDKIEDNDNYKLFNNKLDIDRYSRFGSRNKSIKLTSCLFEIAKELNFNVQNSKRSYSQIFKAHFNNFMPKVDQREYDLIINKLKKCGNFYNDFQLEVESIKSYVNHDFIENSILKKKKVLKKYI